MIPTPHHCGIGPWEEDPVMSEELERKVNRRRLLRRAGTVAAGVAGAGVASAAVGSPAEAAPGSPVLQGSANDAGDTTTYLTAQNVSFPTLELTNTGENATTGESGPPLRLAPGKGTISSAAPVGSLQVDPAGGLWGMTTVGRTFF